MHVDAAIEDRWGAQKVEDSMQLFFNTLWELVNN